MVLVSVDEINLQRLLDRTKRLCRENSADNIWKLKAAIVELETIFSRLQDDRNLDTDLLMQYGRDVHQIRILVEAQQKKTPVERLRWIELIPSAFPTSVISNDDFMAEPTQPNLLIDRQLSSQSTADSGSISVDMLKAKNKSVYIADLRKQLLGGTQREIRESGEDVLHTEEMKQEELAEELRAMAILMKQTYSTAGDVIKQDNVTLTRLQDTAELNRTKLETESRRLEEHAYRSWCDCMYLIGIFVIVASFLAMVLVMRVFSKKYYH